MRLQHSLNTNFPKVTFKLQTYFCCCHTRWKVQRQIFNWGPLSLADRSMSRPSSSSNQPSEPPRSSKNKEHPSRSPRRRREGKRSQRRGDDHEQLLWEMERRRLPGQHEHLEPSGSSCDTAESSPKRFALQVASWSAVPFGVRWLLS